jgi:putative glutamine amidotransferase
MPQPVIGITRDFDAPPPSGDIHYDNYAQSVSKGGGKPLPLYYAVDLARVSNALDSIDALVLSGGNDLDPALYGETRHPQAVPVEPRRQQFELALLAEAERRRMPILGICLGCQLMNVHRGGSLIQFLPEHERPSAVEHRALGDLFRRHPATAVADSRVARATGKRQLVVNTSHKQAIRRLGRGLRVIAHSCDGIIEGIQGDSMPLFLGVQGHPERLHMESEHLSLFRLLVTEARAASA